MTVTRRKYARNLAMPGIRADAVEALRGLTTRRDPTDREWDNELLRNPSIEPEVVTLVTDDGAKLRVHAYGPANAEPIVLIHGWTCRIEYWNPQINALSGKYRVIAYDHRGHGHSTLGKRKLDVDVLADDLAAVLAATVSPRKKALLVGHSMGGMSIMAWAGRHPKQVTQYASGVMLTSTGADRLVANTTVVPLPAAITKVPDLLGRAVLGAPVPLAPLATVARPVFRSRIMSASSTKEEVEFCQRIVFACKGRARAKWGLALASLDVSAALSNLTVPTTVIGGEFDNLTPPSHSRKLADALTMHGALDRLVILPNVGHMSNIEAIEEFNAEIVRMRSLSKRRKSRRSVTAVAG